MIKIKPITMGDMREYILNKPDETSVNMSENLWSDPCGCIMVQYGREILGIEKPAAGYCNIYDTDDNDTEIAQLAFNMDDLINESFFCRVSNYGELKKRLRNCEKSHGQETEKMLRGQKS
jgi:hypothetical protein